jgi:hypothetical protein
MSYMQTNISKKYSTLSNEFMNQPENGSGAGVTLKSSTGGT